MTQSCGHERRARSAPRRDAEAQALHCQRPGHDLVAQRRHGLRGRQADRHAALVLVRVLHLHAPLPQEAINTMAYGTRHAGIEKSGR